MRYETEMIPYSSTIIMKAALIRRLTSLVAQIQPESSVSPREAEKLLYRIKSSFRTNLDRNHPSVQHRVRTNPEYHFQKILAGPYFANAGACHIPNFSTIDIVPQPKSLNQRQQFVNSPMISFRRCISEGTATHEDAVAYLYDEFRKALASSDVGLRESLRLCGAGTTVLTWLYSSSRGRSLSFLRHHELRTMLIPFIIAEGLEHLIWEWMRELKTLFIQSRSEDGASAIREIRKIQAHLIVKWFAFERRLGTDLSSTIEMFSKRVQSISHLVENPILNNVILYFLQALRKHPVTNGHSIDVLVQIIDKYDYDPQVRRSLAGLYRPEGPDIASALTVLRQYPTESIGRHHRRRQNLLFLSLRLAEMLLKDETDKAMRSAAWVLIFIETHFPAMVSIKQEDVPHKAHTAARSESDEASILLSLDALSAE